MTARSTDLDGKIVAMRHRIRSYCLKLTKNTTKAEDLLQSTLLLALEKEHLFERGTNLIGWMCTITRNLFLSEINKYKNETSLDDIRTHHQKYFSDDWEDDFLEPITEPNQLASLMLQEVLDAHPLQNHDKTKALFKRRLTFAVHTALGDSYEEVAKDNNLAVGTVKSSINRAREMLLEEMGHG